MKRKYFLDLEHRPHNDSLPLDQVINELAFNEDGLIAVIAQDANSNDVLMFAWMNKEALKKTIATQRMTYWSRSRQELWVKGETSGHAQHVRSMSFDCDGDAILCSVEQVGAPCHTDRSTCFYLEVDFEAHQVNVANNFPA